MYDTNSRQNLGLGTRLRGVAQFNIYFLRSIYREFSKICSIITYLKDNLQLMKRWHAVSKVYGNYIENQFCGM